MPRVSRVDLSSGPAPRLERLGSGALRLDAAITRVGVLTYSDGTETWGELKTPEEVFAADSIESLAGLPLTIGHPPDLVSPATWDSVAVGHVGDACRPERDSGLVVAPVVVASADAIASVERGDLVEVSAGYSCDLDPTPGTYNGTPYRAVQRRIRYNHAALGPRGWGRAGADVRLRLDGLAVEVSPPPPSQHTDMMDPKNPKGDAPMPAPAPAEPAPSSDAARIAALESALADAMRSNAELRAKLEAMMPKPEMEVELEDSLPPAVQDSIASKRLRLLAGVRAVCGAETRTDGVSSADLRATVVARAFPSVKLDGLDAKAVAALSDAALDAVSSAARTVALAAAHPGAPAPRTDSLDLDPADALRRRSADAWRAAKDH